MEFKAVDGGIVVRYRIIGTSIFVHEALERSNGIMNGHSSIRSGSDFGLDGWFGRVGTAPLPKEIDALPAYSAARSKAYRDWRDAENSRAYRMIEAAFPAVLAPEGRYSDGQIETFETKGGA